MKKAALQALAGWIAWRLAINAAAWIVPGGRSGGPEHGLRYLAVFLLAVPALVAALALLLRLSDERLADIGLRRPSRGWLKTCLIAAACIPALLIGATLVGALGSELGLSTADPVFDTKDPLSLAGFLVGSPIAGGFGEELLYRGFLQSRLERALGTVARPRTATLVALCITSAVFGLEHLYQGWLGVAVTTFYGLAFGALHLAARRRLPLPMIVHGGIDVASFAFLARG